MLRTQSQCTKRMHCWGAGSSDRPCLAIQRLVVARGFGRQSTRAPTENDIQKYGEAANCLTCRFAAGRPTLRPSRPHRGVRATGALPSRPRHLPPRGADCRSLDLDQQHLKRDQTEITQRHFQLPTGPCARVPGQQESSAPAAIGRGDAGGVGAQLAQSLCVVGPRRVGGSRPHNGVARLCGPFELPMSPIGTPTSVVEGSADMPRTCPIRRS
jgi:hypothetical protein